MAGLPRASVLEGCPMDGCRWLALETGIVRTRNNLDGFPIWAIPAGPGQE
ncbi:hypothetical protein HPP92_028802 [Vanilla planifolia]|uniref:Uncharacterized protein n=1 Tax=Vanilla planifolia TaxID=51239 RepID=A0A835U322_VANPL|nr:hypothetical protein HPP92_028802 [Vanilla planifolia]KAG0446515.1 hypothetical protein HPP92_028791 [Vanilla planifolia]